MRVKCRRPLRVEWSAVALCPRSIKRTGILVFSAIRDGNLGSVRFSATLQASLIGQDAAELAQPAVNATDGEVGMATRSSRLMRPCRVALSVEVALVKGAENPPHLVGPVAGGARLMKMAAVISTPSDLDADHKTVFAQVIGYAVERNELQVLRLPREDHRAVLGLLQRDGGLHAHR